jgi:hypothetical protein
MRKTIESLVPFAGVLAAVAVIIWLLLAMHWALGRWLLGGFLMVHGWIHLFFVMPGPDEEAAAGRRLGLGAHEARVMGSLLIGVVAIGFLLVALATVLPTGFWAALVVISSVASLALLTLFFSPQLSLGMVVDVVMLLIVVTGAWAPW